jgi:RimJ/RimL family protein N-acetyltransferase
MNGSIKTERLLLRKYTEADRDASVRLSLDKDVMHFMGGEHAETEEEANMIFDKCLEVYGGSLNGKPLGSRRFEIWGIELISGEHEGKLIGHFELKQTPNTNGNELEIVYLLDKEYWGRGLMPEAIKAVNQYANSTGTQVIGTINPENIRTVRSLEKAGIEKQEWIGKGENRVYKVWLKTR